MQVWKDRPLVIIIDAVVSGKEPGHVFRFDAIRERIPAKFFNYSSHAFSLAEAVEVSRALGSLPDRLIIFGIEGQNFATGASVTDAVANAVEQVTKVACGELFGYKQSYTLTQTQRGTS